MNRLQQNNKTIPPHVIDDETRLVNSGSSSGVISLCGASKEIATVSICLTKNHKDCLGGYKDFNDTYLIKCGCSCHNRHVREKERSEVSSMTPPDQTQNDAEDNTQSSFHQAREARRKSDDEC
jgi:hypothetical protein